MMSQSLVRSELTAAETATIRMVLDGLPSEHSRRAYERALADFFYWHRGVGRPQLNKAIVQRYAAELRDAGLSSSSVNQRLSAIRKLAAEAADNGALDPAVANGIRAVRGARQEGRRTGNWLTREQAQSWLIALSLVSVVSLAVVSVVVISCVGRRSLSVARRASARCRFWLLASSRATFARLIHLIR